MAHITLAVPNEVYSEMKNHPDIKWSEVARRSIVSKLQNLRTSVSGEKLLETFSKEFQQDLKKVSKMDWKAFHTKTQEKAWKRLSLTRTD